MSIGSLLLIIALIIFVVDSFMVTATKVKLLPLGLALLCLAMLVGYTSLIVPLR